MNLEFTNEKTLAKVGTIRQRTKGARRVEALPPYGTKKPPPRKETAARVHSRAYYLPTAKVAKSRPTAKRGRGLLFKQSAQIDLERFATMWTLCNGRPFVLFK